MTLLNDEPTVDDQLQRANSVSRLAKEILDCKPPRVFGVHGDWGAGKTSYLRLLEFYLSGECPACPDATDYRLKKLWPSRKAPENISLVWFDAWQYQHEAAPIVALLGEIRAQLSWRKRATRRGKKLFEVGLESALLNLESLTKVIGIKASAIKKTGEEWEKRNHDMVLPTAHLRELLISAINELLGGDDQKLVILIDDLDRCEPKTAYRILEGIKIYLSLPNVVFVLGMDPRLIERAIAQSLEHIDESKRKALAKEYMEKICQSTHHLDLVLKPHELLQHSFGKSGDPHFRGRLFKIVEEFNVMPANPRKIKAFAHTLSRFMYCSNTADNEALGEGLNRQAGITVMLAAIYHFHTPLYKQLQADHRFYALILEFAENLIVKHRAFENIDIGEPPAEEDTSSPTPSPTKSNYNLDYPEPGDDRSFRIRRLIRELEDVTPGELSRFLTPQS